MNYTDAAVRSGSTELTEVSGGLLAVLSAATPALPLYCQKNRKEATACTHQEEHHRQERVVHRTGGRPIEIEEADQVVYAHSDKRQARDRGDDAGEE